MTRYFLDLIVGDGVAMDEVGHEFATVEAAKAEAHRVMAEVRGGTQRRGTVRLKVRLRSQQTILYVLNEAAND